MHLKKSSFLFGAIACLIIAGFWALYAGFESAKITGQGMPVAASTTVPSISSMAAVSEPVGQLFYRTLAPATSTTYAYKPVAHGPLVDWVPDIGAEATKEAVRSGPWSSVFPNGSLSADDIVRIPAGVTVTYDSADQAPIQALVVDGTLSFSATKSTKLSVGTLLIENAGRLQVKPDASHTAEISFHGIVPKAKDPSQIAFGLVAYGGSVDIEGREVAVPFAKVSGSKGQRAIVTGRPTGWKTGDRVLLSASTDSGVDPTYWWYSIQDPSRRQPFPEEWEAATISSIDGSSIVLDKALSYDHDGYIANRDRNVIVRSDPNNPQGARGHVMFMGHTDVTVLNARFFDLGRTTVDPIDDASFSENGSPTHLGLNQRGRYALHAHRLMMPFVFQGNVIDGSNVVRPYGNGERGILGSPRWGIVNHDSFGTIASNVIIGAAGSGITAEDGTETGTVMNNLVIGTGGGSGQPDDERFGAAKGKDIANGGFGFWFRGPFLEVTGNVAAGHFPQSAFTYFVHPDLVPTKAIMAIPGQPPGLGGLSHQDLQSREPIRLFSGNTGVGFFGGSGFSIFYEETPVTINALTIDARGSGSDSLGVLVRHSDSVTIKDSYITGHGQKAGVVASPDGGTVHLANTTVQGFGP